ncbi:A1S_2505 family phage non-structural protein [Luteimicrobium subarcticum]|uniref:Uncharacterized protein n=1 Tax=Luteimicrobium subarcticum TaxID=620910 RepID=A0A2M8WJE1_9MICO|nr:hypothetical protein [Luteimicrobium subarcticum]PJI91033.1 hypothetical protein CLV34_2292 [Luteimicrobium subarcticum]
MTAQRTTPARIESLGPDEIFVFGSNDAGSHGAGAARTAYERFGAVWGQGHGLQGRSYAVDTMSGREVMARDVEALVATADENPHLTFLVTPIGTGIAGWSAHDVAPLFVDAPENVVLPAAFLAVLDALPHGLSDGPNGIDGGGPAGA